MSVIIFPIVVTWFKGIYLFSCLYLKRVVAYCTLKTELVKENRTKSKTIPCTEQNANRVHAFFLLEQFYKNKEAQICPKIKSKLRTIEARLQMQI